MGFSSTIPVACSPFPLSSSSSRSSLPVFFPTCISSPSLQTKPLILPAIKPFITSSRKTGSRSRYFIRALSSAIMGSKSVKGGGELLVFENEEGLSVSLAEYTAGLSEKFAKERGAFAVVLSGGSLVKALRKLVESPYFESVDWGKWHVFWVDERVVPKDHEDSNYKLAYDGFLSKVPIPPGQVYAINDALSAEGAADDYETCLRHLVKAGVLDFNLVDEVPKFDLMLLGMGPDGHVASLFPDHPLINEKQKWVTFIKDSPKPPPERITFTFPVINASANVALVVTGAGKANAACRALQSNAIDGSDLLPVQMVSLKVGKLTWFTDKDATSKL